MSTISKRLKMSAVATTVVAAAIAGLTSLPADAAAPHAHPAVNTTAAKANGKGKITKIHTGRYVTTGTPSQIAAAKAAAQTHKGAPRTGIRPMDSNAGAPITRSAVMARAEAWVAAQVPYSQSADYTNSAGTYRTDCSGFVSMAWDLPDSAPNWGENTASLPNFATKLGSLDDLQPGDMIDNISDHVVLFKGWTDSTHTTAMILEEPHTGATAREDDSYYTRSYLTANGFLPYRYNNIAPDTTAPMTNLTAGHLGGGHTDLVALETATGNLYVYPGTGAISGTSTLGARVQVGSNWGGMTDLTLGDFTKSGHDSLIAVDSSTGNLYLYPGSGSINGTSTLGARVQIGSNWGGMTNLTAINLGGTEGLLATDSAGALWFYPGSGSINGTSTLGARVQVGSNWGSMTDLSAPGALNKDGKADLLAVDGSGNLFAYPFSGTVNGTSTFGARVQIGSNWNAMSYLTGGDLNGDGTGDLLAVQAASNAPGNLYAYPGTGALNGTSTLGTRVQIGSNW